MKITIITLFPKMISSFIEESIVKRAQEKGAVEIELINLREFALDSYGSVDDRPYGGGAGMVLRVEPLVEALKKVGFLEPSKAKNNPRGYTVLTSAKGPRYSQKKALEYAKLDHLVIVAGHYEEVDERVREYVDEEVSLGDFVMTGGELTAAAIIDSVTRLLPGVLKKEDATRLESFFEVEVAALVKLMPENELLIGLQKNGVQKVNLLEYPHYTRPEEFEGKKVPEVLLSGHQKNIDEWRLKHAFLQTLQKRPDLLK